jgi:hypothetical protein
MLGEVGIKGRRQLAFQPYPFVVSDLKLLKGPAVGMNNAPVL